MTGLDWEKAKRAGKTRRRPSGRSTKKTRHDRQIAMWQFVKRHEIECFKCGKADGEWAKTGLSDRGPWAICMECVKR